MKRKEHEKKYTLLNQIYFSYSYRTPTGSTFRVLFYVMRRVPLPFHALAFTWYPVLPLPGACHRLLFQLPEHEGFVSAETGLRLGPHFVLSAIGGLLSLWAAVAVMLM